MTEPIDEKTIAVLAAVADLPLSEGRYGPVQEVLWAWLPDANALNRKMSAQEHWTVTPATVFTHPATREVQA